MKNKVELININKRTDHFDRFFAVFLAVPTGLETVTRNYLGAQ